MCEDLVAGHPLGCLTWQKLTYIGRGSQLNGDATFAQVFGIFAIFNFTTLPIGFPH
jgi:hypothetical protein